MKTMIKWAMCLLVSIALLVFDICVGDVELGVGAGFCLILTLAALPAALKGRF